MDEPNDVPIKTDWALDELMMISDSFTRVAISTEVISLRLSEHEST